jgi:two-component system, NtrC family, response regulator AtoC
MARILVVDDEQRVRESLCSSLSNRGFDAESASSGEEAVRHLLGGELSAVILDLRLGAENGLDLIPRFLRLRPGIPIIMLTAYAEVETAVQAMKIGATDYVRKPIRIPDLVKTLEENIGIPRSAAAAGSGRTDGSTSPAFITRNAQMLSLLGKAAKIARSDLPILIQGESGTGKEVLAALIHAASQRGSLPMHVVNCSAMPESLLDNELFGHERGAFTGADRVFRGVFEQAGGSSLLLDELGDMPLSLQPKILRTIQNNEIRRLGGSATISVDVRFIAASNQDLEQLIQERCFREDLYYRLNMAPFRLLPLRERREDIIPLAEHFLQEAAIRQPGRSFLLSENVKELLLSYPWPGNARELKSVILFAATVAAEEKLGLKDLPPFITAASAPEHAAGRSLKDNEKSLIIDVLELTGHTIKRSAEILGITRATLYKKMLKYGIPRGSG